MDSDGERLSKLLFPVRVQAKTTHVEHTIHYWLITVPACSFLGNQFSTDNNSLNVVNSHMEKLNWRQV